MALAPSRRGIALFMVSALLALLALLAAALLGGTRFASSASAVGVARTGARNAAGSGLAYAAARLAEQGGGYPLFPRTTENGSDDWAYREATTVPLSRAECPSWAHGPFRSGRLRGADDAFALRIDAVGGGLPINAGPPDDPGLIHALDNLGAILLEATPDRTARIGREDVPAGSPAPGEPILVSYLGEHLLSGRPAGGYPTVAAVREALLAHTYTPEECAAILPHLDIGPYDTIGASGSVDATGQVAVHQPVELSSATLPVLKSLWMYLRPAGQGYSPHFLYFGGAPPPAYGEAGARAGGNVPYTEPHVLTIYPDEAEELARLAAAFRARPDPASWLALRQEIVAGAPVLFRRDHDRLSGAGFPAEAALWARMKADIAFFAVTRDRPADGVVSNWADWTLWHGAAGAAHPVFLANMKAFLGMPRPASPTTPRWPDADENHPYHRTGTFFQPVGLTLAPPVRFSVAALGRNGNARETASGTFRAAERLEFTCQEDFENRAPATHLADRGMAAEAPARTPPVSRIPLDDPDDPAMLYPQVVTIPDAHFPGWTSPGAAHPAFDRYRGAIGLAARAYRLADAVSPSNRPWAAVSPIDHYWPFAENDLLTDPEGEFSSITPGSVPLVTHPLDTLTSGPWWCGADTQIDPDMLPPGYPILGLGGDTCIEMWLSEHHADPGPCAGLDLRTYEIGQGTGGGPSGNDGDGEGGGSPPVEGFMNLQAVPLENDTFFRLVFLDWPVLDLATNSPDRFSGDIFLNPAAGAPRVYAPDHVPASGRIRSGQEHVVVTMDEQPSGTLLALHVNGVGTDSRFLPVHFRGDGTHLGFRFIDEIRWFHWLPDAVEIRARYLKGRFALPVAAEAASFTYRSPRYRFDAPARICSGSWTGIPCHDPRIGISVRARGLDAAGGMVRDMRLGPAGTVTRFATGTPFDEFDYDVSFVNSLVEAEPSPLYHTPIFESVWFTFQQRGRSPAWDRDR